MTASLIGLTVGLLIGANYRFVDIQVPVKAGSSNKAPATP
jgi:hypothetical protein